MNTQELDYDLRHVPAYLLDALELRAGAPARVEVFRPVLALTVTRSSDNGTEVLVGVRDADENLTHPNVLSSPTRRIHGHDGDIEKLGAAMSQREAVVVPAWLEAEAHALLTTRVGLDEAAVGIEYGPAQVWQAESIIATCGDEIVSEPLTMVNVHISISAGIVVPVRTMSYAHQCFAPLEVHRLAYSQRDSALLVGVSDPSDQPIIYGICTASTSAMLDLIGKPTSGRLLTSSSR